MFTLPELPDLPLYPRWRKVPISSFPLPSLSFRVCVSSELLHLSPLSLVVLFLDRGSALSSIRCRSIRGGIWGLVLSRWGLGFLAGCVGSPRFSNQRGIKEGFLFSGLLIRVFQGVACKRKSVGWMVVAGIEETGGNARLCIGGKVTRGTICSWIHESALPFATGSCSWFSCS